MIYKVIRQCVREVWMVYTNKFVKVVICNDKMFTFVNQIEVKNENLRSIKVWKMKK